MLILIKYSYSGYGIGFDACRSFSLSGGSGGKNNNNFQLIQIFH